MVIVPVEIPFKNLPEKHLALVNRSIPRRDFQLPPDVAEVVRRKAPVIPPEEDNSRLVASFS
jgi:hypothetical protein